jgi:hypothetical protein
MANIACAASPGANPASMSDAMAVSAKPSVFGPTERVPA